MKPRSENTMKETLVCVQELLERLWDISDKRKEQDEKESAAVRCGWLEDHIAFLINHHIMLVRVTFHFWLIGSVSIQSVFMHHCIVSIT